MNAVAFKQSISASLSLLKELDIFRMKGTKVLHVDGVSQDFIGASQDDDYFRLYQIGLTNFDFDILIEDQSYFQFTFNEGDEHKDLRYAFLQNPQEYKTYSEYLEILREQNIIEDESEEDIGGIFLEDYNQFLNELKINPSFVYIRYDLDHQNYSPLIHSVSHFHIGNSDHVRIPCDKIITPLKFVIFVLKNCYYHQWKSWIENNKDVLIQLIDSEKASCVKLEVEHWQDKERKELYLT